MKTNIALLFFMVCVTSSSALKCYSCTFPGDSKCGSPDTSVVKDCGEPSFAEIPFGVKPVCLKTSIKANDVDVITRSCSLQGGTYNPCSVSSAKDENCSVCESELCNGSSRMKFGFLTLLPIAVLFSVKFF